MKPFDLPSTPIEPGITLIEASAGTGKTYTLTGLVLRLLLEQDIELPKILVVTFTIAATDELKGRIRQRLSEALAVFEGAPTEDPLLAELRSAQGDRGRDKLRLALLQLDEIGIYTIHAFCKRALEDSAFESGLPFQPDFVEEEWALLRECAEDFWRRTFYEAPPLTTCILQHEGWDPTSFLGGLTEVLRQIDPQIRPEGRPLADCLREIQSAYESVQASKSDRSIEMIEQILPKKPTKSQPLSHLPAEELSRRLADFLHHPSRGLDVALFLAGRKPAKSKAARASWQALGDGGALHAALHRLAVSVDSLESSLRTAFFTEVAAQFDRRKRDARTITFDDLLSHLATALNDPEAGPRVQGAIRARFQVALIDEFQDTDARQWDIFSKLFAEQTLFLIGDPKQAIYSFRGADVFTYLKAQRHADRRYGLTTNWRSRAPLLAAINALFASHPLPFAVEDIDYQPVAAAPGAELPRLEGDDSATKPLQWWSLPEDALKKKDEASCLLNRAVATEIVRLLSSDLRLGKEPLQPRDIAVLVRSNAQALAMQDELRRAHVPAIVTNVNDIFQSPEMNELQRLLEAIHEPRNPFRLRAAWATELWGDDAERILALSEDEAFEQRVALFEEWRRLWLQHGLAPMLFDVLAQRGIRARLLRLPDGERRLTNLLHCIEIVHAERGDPGESPEGTLQWLRRHRHQKDHHGEAAELRLESDEHAVRILTIHKSKGLEYEIVFCPFLTLYKKPQKLEAPGGYWKAHEGDALVFDFDAPKPFVARAHEEALAEDLRLAYVAITRAKERCYLPFAAIGQGRKKAHHTPLGHLIGPPCAFADDLIPEASFARLEALIAANSDTMALDPAPAPDRLPRWKPPTEKPAELRARTFTTPLQQLSTWRLASFSSLKTGAESRERPDHLDPVEPEAALAAPESNGFLGFARGARAGICLHEIFEHVDFQDLDTEESLALIRQRLARFGLDDPMRHPACDDPVEAVHTMLNSVVTAELPSFGWRLADLSRKQRLEEWAFHLPIGSFSPADLSEVFARRAIGPVRDEYAARLKQLSRDTVRGFLHGFVDLVTEHDGRWYLLDWKSNHLGTRPRDYGEASLWRAMIEHHYVLQYHLYLVGLHRFLRSRLPDYDFRRHVGGIAYVFIRGVALEPKRGWFIDRPPLELIEAIDEFLRSGRS